MHSLSSTLERVIEFPHRSVFLEDLIQGERAAIESYYQVVDKFIKTTHAPELKKISEEHWKTLQKLIDFAELEQQEFPLHSGPWGAWAKLVVGTAKLAGLIPALRVLREGEQYGWRLYVDALQSDLNSNLCFLIREQLIPQQELNILSLENMIASESH